MNILRKTLFLMPVLLAFCSLQAQDIKGIVYEKDSKGQKNPLVGVNIYWLGTTVGVASDSKGNFGINRINGNNKLVISYIGYQADTIELVLQQRRLEVVLEASREITGAEINARQANAHLSTLKPIQTQVITKGELQKAACCNLSESFETNASVDVSYADAISGAKQIQLLGIPGKYSQMMFENIPNLRGLSSTYGLMYIPGPWMESIQVSKGTASVINGYESVSGQINVEYKKPENSEKLHLNLFLSDAGQIEVNANTAIRVNEKWNSAILAHASKSNRKMDHQGDLFLDHPLTEQINVMNRWSYHGKQWEARIGVRALAENRKGGQMVGLPESAPNFGNPYLIDITTKHFEAFSKTGWISPHRASTSVALIANLNYHDRSAIYGRNIYDGVQKSFYSNFLYQSYLGNTAHTFTTGASLSHDAFNEKLNDSTFDVKETIPGAYLEYTYNNFKKLILITGIRADYHNKFGPFATPRLHLRYEIDSNTTVRASAGMGYRTARIIAENNQLLATSRRLIIRDEPKMEKAINFGINLSHSFEINHRLLTVSADAYRTSFVDQVIVDMDQSTQDIYIYNLDGKAFANSYQVEATWEPIKNFDVVLAYRWSDVKVTQNSELVRKPLVNKYKGLVNLSYATNLRKWQFDFTAQFNGDTRLPDTKLNPVAYQRPEVAPAYTIIHAQVSKFFRSWNIYLGVENLTNFVQKDPIIAANDPYGKYFDSSMVWGPVLGRKIYTGIRYTID